MVRSARGSGEQTAWGWGRAGDICALCTGHALLQAASLFAGCSQRNKHFMSTTKEQRLPPFSMTSKSLRRNGNGLVISPHETLGKSPVKQFDGNGVSKLLFPISCIPHQGMLSKPFSNTSYNSIMRVSCLVILFRFISLWGGSVSAHKWYVLETNQRERWSSRQLTVAELNCSSLTSKRMFWHIVTAGQGCFYLLIFL